MLINEDLRREPHRISDPLPRYSKNPLQSRGFCFIGISSPRQFVDRLLGRVRFRCGWIAPAFTGATVRGKDAIRRPVLCRADVDT